MFTLYVFGIYNCIFTGVSLKMSRSHSSLLLCLEYCLYEHTTGVKPIFLTSNHSDSDQSKIKSVLSLSDTTRVQLSHELICQIFINGRQLLNLCGERSIWIEQTRAEHKTDGSRHSRWKIYHEFHQCVFQECGCESWKCTGVSSDTECGCHMPVWT